MKYRDRTTGDIYTDFALRQKFSNVSFPAAWNQSTLDFCNVDMVVETIAPSADEFHKTNYTGVQFVDGIWTETWEIVPLFDDPVEQAAYVEQQAALNIVGKWNSIRQHRAQLLAETDYTQLPDTPISAASRLAFAEYRQALRNVTAQPNPYDIIWPTLPTYEKGI